MTLLLLASPKHAFWNLRQFTSQPCSIYHFQSTSGISSSPWRVIANVCMDMVSVWMCEWSLLFWNDKFHNKDRVWILLISVSWKSPYNVNWIDDEEGKNTVNSEWQLCSSQGRGKHRRRQKSTLVLCVNFWGVEMQCVLATAPLGKSQV